MPVTSFANNLSQSVSCLFVLFMISFAVQRLVSLLRFHLFVFISLALGDWSKKALVQFRSENVLSIFSSRSFMVSCLYLSLPPYLSLRGKLSLVKNSQKPYLCYPFYTDIYWDFLKDTETIFIKTNDSRYYIWGCKNPTKNWIATYMLINLECRI